MKTFLKKIGNSFGVILYKKMLGKAGITATMKITIEAHENAIVISPFTKRQPLNRDLATWRRQINAANKLGQKTEKNVWSNSLSEEEKKEWTR